MNEWKAIKWRTNEQTTVAVDDPTVAGGKRVIAQCETPEDARLIAMAPQLLAFVELEAAGCPACGGASDECGACSLARQLIASCRAI